MATLIIFLFSVLSSLLWGSSAQTSVTVINTSYSILMTSTIFYLNSSQPSTWSNDHSINQTVDFSDGSRARLVLSRDPITCGFYCTGACNSYLFSVVVRGESKIRTPQVSFPGLVWSANRDYPVGENATLKLTRHEGLVLRDSDDTKVWSTNISGNSVMGMNITDSGNLVLFNDEGAMVWQSFDHPADSLCIGQSLHEGQKLIASAPGANWSHGSYYATFTSSAGFAAFIEAGQPLMYFQLVPNQSARNSGKTNYTIFERGYGLVVKSGNLQAQAGSLVVYFPLDSYFQHIRLDSDGQLRIYQYRKGDEWRVISDLVAEKLGECQYPRRCGDYGVCREAQCSCPEGKDGMQYFKQTQVQLPELGCSRITPLSCKPSLDQHRLLEVENVTYFNLIDSDAAFPGYKDIDGCKQACLQNCSCSAVFFKYESNASNGHCYLPSEILSIRGGKMPNYNFTSTAFIKVQIPYMAPSPLPIEGPTSGVSPPSPPSKNRLNLVAIIAGSSAGALVIVCLLIIFYFVNLRKNTVEEEGEDYIKQMAGVPMRFSYENLRVATEDFKEKLGGGGFGSVFKGMLGDGTSIAVKRLDRMGQGTKEFLAEVETIGSIHHFNLVRLIGFCAEKSSRLLVYEYMSNGSLDNWIFHRDQRPSLDWQARKKIILDIAKGLAYLHEECRQRIVHLDIKPQNILLDNNFNAKVSDFGLSKLIDRDESQVMTTMRGTPGYLAPEWRRSKITVKVDIYSFGIVVLEIVCGRKNLDRSQPESNLHLLSVLQKKAEDDRLMDILDNLNADMQSHREEAVRMIRIAAWCLQDDHTRRPLMSVVVKVLEGVMEVDPNIIYRFSNAMAPPSVADDPISTAPQASVLSAPR